MVCVPSVAAGVCWAGLNVKMQPWGIQAAPLLCAVRSFGHAFNLWGGGVSGWGRGWVGVMNHCQTSGYVPVCICQAMCLSLFFHCVSHVCVCLHCGFTCVVKIQCAPSVFFKKFRAYFFYSHLWLLLTFSKGAVCWLSRVTGLCVFACLHVFSMVLCVCVVHSSHCGFHY